MRINLLPKEIKEERKQAQIILNVFLGCLGFLFIIIVGLFVLEAAEQTLTANLNTLNPEIQRQQQQIDKLKSIEEKAKAVNNTLSAIDELEAQRTRWSTVLKEFSASVPPTVQITALSLTGKKASTGKKAPEGKLSGKGTSFREIIGLKEKLESSSYFKDVTFTTFNKNSDKEQVSYSFNLNFSLEDKEK